MSLAPAKCGEVWCPAAVLAPWRGVRWWGGVGWMQKVAFNFILDARHPVTLASPQRLVVSKLVGSDWHVCIALQMYGVEGVTPFSEWLIESHGNLFITLALLAFLTVTGKTSLTHAFGWCTGKLRYRPRHALGDDVSDIFV